MYHTRGSVLRGLDEGVRQMSLGEKAHLFVREDYGIGDIWAGWNLPPDSPLEIEVALSEIDGKGSRWFFVKRLVLTPVVKTARCFRVGIELWNRYTGCICPCTCHFDDTSQKRQVELDDSDDDDDLMRGHWSDDK